MPSSSVHLPDGQSYSVQPVFGGLFFKSKELNIHPVPFPAGWTVAIHTEVNQEVQLLAVEDEDGECRPAPGHTQRYRRPTLQNDNIFISSISNPSSNDFKPPASPSRQIALMLWISLYWYFQQTEPAPYLDGEGTNSAPAEARPRGEWRIRIKREGIFRSKNMIPKLERMGLITSFDSSVGSGAEDEPRGWDQMFVTRRMFWQIHGGIFLFTLQPMKTPYSSFSVSPVASRQNSPVPRDVLLRSPSPSPALRNILAAEVPGETASSPLPVTPNFPKGPYHSSSHLPTYYPPPPLQYIITNNIRHPRRQKPFRMGEIFYSRFFHSVGKYLSFRVASSSPKPVTHSGPVAKGEKSSEFAHLCSLSDNSLLQRWLSKPRVSAFWGEYFDDFLPNALKSQHSFPAIGMWDGVPFGFFEIYWVKEDTLGQHMGSDAQDFDRGMHVLVGEEWARGKVAAWLSSLLHWCWQIDNRTMNIYLEPRVDNTRSVLSPF
ncbi:acyl-CoA N-acyltransferase [Nemania sp. FL0916]|nr:acyl-CoA N-acyltransferase [Nemania sp. FL0916]